METLGSSSARDEKSDDAASKRCHNYLYFERATIIFYLLSFYNSKEHFDPFQKNGNGNNGDFHDATSCGFFAIEIFRLNSFCFDTRLERVKIIRFQYIRFPLWLLRLCCNINPLCMDRLTHPVR